MIEQKSLEKRVSRGLLVVIQLVCVSISIIVLSTRIHEVYIFYVSLPLSSWWSEKEAKNSGCSFHTIHLKRPKIILGYVM